MRGRRSARLLALLVSIILAALVLETGARLFWYQRHGVPLGSPDRILYAYYPELREVDEARPDHDDDFYDVLVLAGSVLHPEWGNAVQDLKAQLEDLVTRRVRVFNLAMPAHTSRDSRLRYEALREHGFELVIFYHGINEVRANNVPPELFREDYSHYSWYEVVNALAAYHGRSSFAVPYTLRFLALRVRQIMEPDRYVPTHDPREEWLDFGAEVRTAVSFDANLETVLELARDRGDSVMLMTFAIHVPDNYSHEAFAAKQLDYGRHLLPLETWGRPPNVRKAVAAHNDIVRRKAVEHQEALLVDQARLIEGSAENFDDACHLTAAGASVFARNVHEVLRSALGSSQP